MSYVTLIDKVYDFLIEKKDNVSFDEIWEHLKVDIKSRNINEVKADVYTELVLDNRFALTVEGKWALRDYLKYDDVKKQYEYIDKFMTTEEFDISAQYSDGTNDQTRVININDKINLKNKFEDISIDDFEDTDLDIDDTDDDSITDTSANFYDEDDD